MGYYQCAVNYTIHINLTKCYAEAPKVTELYMIPVLCIIGLACNVLSFVVLHVDQVKRDSVMLLKVLAVADGLYLISALVRYLPKYIITNMDVLGHIEIVAFPLINCFQTICIYMIVLVTVDRYLCVCQPLRISFFCTHQSRIKWSVGVFVCGMLYNLPRFFAKCYYLFVYNCNGSNGITEVRMWPKTYFNKKYHDIYADGFFYILLMYAIPLSLLFVMTIQLVRAIQRLSHRLSQTTTTLSHLSHHYNVENNATMVLAVAVIVFILCQTPEPIIKLIQVIAEKDIDNWKKYKRIIEICIDISNLLMVINSSINFFIYFMFGRRFRGIVRRMFRAGYNSTK